MGRKPDAKELAERLRANLKRRKQQQRARRSETGRDNDGGEGTRQ